MINRQIGESRIRGMVFSPDGDTMLVSTQDGRMHCFRGAFMDEETPMANSRVATYSPAGHYLVSGSGSRFTVQDLRDPLNKERSVAMPGSVSGLAFVGREQLIIALGEPDREQNYSSSLWSVNMQNPKPVRLPVDCRYGVRFLTSYPEARKIIWITDNKWLYVQDITRAPALPSVLPKEAKAMALSQNGRYLAIGSDWEVLLYDVDRWPSRPTVIGRHAGLVTAVAFTPDGRTLLSGSWDFTVRSWDLEGSRPPTVYQWNVGKVSALAVAPDGLRAFVGGDTGAVSIWDLEE